MNLPREFQTEIEQLFRQFDIHGRPEHFFNAMDRAPVYGLRVNRLKICRETLCRWLESTWPQYKLSKVAWSDDGFYYPAGLQPGQLPLYRAGLFYIQEPSAMLPAQVLQVRPGEKVLDLCAAPGGKSARLTADLQDKGLLWANDISAERIRALLRNIELTGSACTLISNAPQAKLAAGLTGFFDAIMVDAPCSGSGMFRRDPAAVGSWLRYGTGSCVPVQRQLLEQAWTMLAPGGRLVYSTCTFSLEENEGNIAWFLQEHEDAVIAAINKADGVSDGLPVTSEMIKTARIWPHLAAGEGHYCALLRKKTTGGETFSDQDQNPPRRDEIPSADEIAAFRQFCRRTFSHRGDKYMESLLAEGRLRRERGHLHLLPFALPESNIRKIKTGLYLGDIRRDRKGCCRFEPSQALLMHMSAEHIKRIYPAPATGGEISRYLLGETLEWPRAETGGQVNEYGAVCLEYEAGKWPLGWVKTMQEPVLKNLYPAGWRKL